MESVLLAFRSWKTFWNGLIRDFLWVDERTSNLAYFLQMLYESHNLFTIEIHVERVRRKTSFPHGWNWHFLVLAEARNGAGHLFIYQEIFRVSPPGSPTLDQDWADTQARSHLLAKELRRFLTPKKAELALARVA